MMTEKVWNRLMCVAGLSFAAAVYFTPAPLPGESDLHYILSGADSPGSIISTMVFAVCTAVMLVFGSQNDD